VAKILQPAGFARRGDEQVDIDVAVQIDAQQPRDIRPRQAGARGKAPLTSVYPAVQLASSGKCQVEVAVTFQIGGGQLLSRR
jgi:hypothetical protein